MSEDGNMQSKLDKNRSAARKQRFVPDCFRWLLLLFIACTLTACGGSRIVNHSFEFDTTNSIPLAEVLDYRYGDSKLPVRAPEWIVKEGRPLYFNAVAGPMLVGDYLYVKWRIKETGQVYEDTVDLRHRLPFFLRDKTVYFDIKGSQLYVYVISPERRPDNMPPNGPKMYDYRKVITIYPDQPKQ
ncbi:MAG: hypothetical protein PHQ60_02660 [Sideroxydans sp.]|nr:hypothetical protein [Sideroxydans sp.]